MFETQLEVPPLDGKVRRRLNLAIYIYIYKIYI